MDRRLGGPQWEDNSCPYRDSNCIPWLLQTAAIPALLSQTKIPTVSTVIDNGLQKKDEITDRMRRKQYTIWIYTQQKDYALAGG
jgi:hypothetical protein